MAKGTSRILARVRASRVLPEPVGPIIRMLLFSISTSACGRGVAFSATGSGWMRL